MVEWIRFKTDIQEVKKMHSIVINLKRDMEQQIRFIKKYDTGHIVSYIKYVDSIKRHDIV